jgi:exopolyphosphatase
MKMNIYLREVKNSVKNPGKPVLVVLGNESVDLDSAVSAVVLGYHLNKFPNSHVVKKPGEFLVVPVINATREQLPLKTEVCHWLVKNGIDLENLLCRDEISLKTIEQFVLVDHHVSEFNDKTIAVLDHRPFDQLCKLGSDCFVNIKEVGSNGTLVCDAIKRDLTGEELTDDYKEVLRICYAPIVLDTINFSRNADKVRPLDIEMRDYIENVVAIQNAESYRKSLYEELVAAREDVSALNSLQVLSKDLKIISNESGSVKIAIPGVDVMKYIEMDDAAENVRKFAARENVDVVFLMGMVAVGDSVRRFGGVINIKNEALFNDVSASCHCCSQLFIQNYFVGD